MRTTQEACGSVRAVTTAQEGWKHAIAGLWAAGTGGTAWASQRLREGLVIRVDEVNTMGEVI